MVCECSFSSKRILIENWLWRLISRSSLLVGHFRPFSHEKSFHAVLYLCYRYYNFTGFFLSSCKGKNFWVSVTWDELSGWMTCSCCCCCCCYTKRQKHTDRHFWAEFHVKSYIMHIHHHFAVQLATDDPYALVWCCCCCLYLHQGTHYTSTYTCSAYLQRFIQQGGYFGILF